MEALVANITGTCPLPFHGATGQLFARSVAAVVAAHCVIFDYYQWPGDEAERVINDGPVQYDFIVVGAGTAGSALAGGLVDLNPKWSVLLIEAGDDPSLNSEVPAFLIYNQDIDWQYNTVRSDQSCLGFRDNRCIWNKGKAMGGSSSINAMLYIRGHPRDYQRWEESGNTGWGYHELIGYFTDIEDKFNLSKYKYHENLWYDLLGQAYMELGLHNYNSNNEGLIGTRITKLLTKDGKRMNTAQAYLEKNKKLSVIKNTKVQKVIFDSKTKIATGVKVRHKDGIVMQITAKKEVILSAGSIATPQILMLSGIGPKTHLNNKGIDCLVDLPVGQNLQDHVILPLLFKTNQDTPITSEMMIMFLLQYMHTKTGPLSNIGITDFMSFIDTNNLTDYPDIQFHHTYFTKQDRFMLRPYLQAYGYKNEVIEAIEDLNNESDLLGIYPTLLHPKSKGEILLSDSDPESEPIIVTNYFKEHEDINTLIRAIKFVQKLEETERFKSLGIKLADLKLPDCQYFKDTETFWECYIRHMATTIYHPIGTTKMGPKHDKTSVVDHNLMVHGVKRLRVVDASVMPTVPGANTMAPTLVIAMKSLDIIRNFYVQNDEL